MTLFVVGIGVCLAGLVAFAAVLWFLAGRVQREGMRRGLPRPAVRAQVVSASDEHVILKAAGRRALKSTGTWSLWWDGGSASISSPQAQPDGSLRFTLDELSGELSPGTTCEFDAAPRRVAGGQATAHEVSYEAPIGRFAGLFVAGSGSRWLICVHGQRSSGRGVFRLLDALTRQDEPKLAVSYRNDAGAPASRTGEYDFGRTEWEDLEAGVQYALDHGAERIVLVAESMGAAIALWFMHNSPLAPRVDGLVLDAPLLDLETSVHWVGRTTGVPAPLLPLAKHLAGIRFSIDWNRYRASDVIDELAVPVLLIHGDRDGQAPYKLSIEVAAAHSDVVSFEGFSGAGHCQSWNLDPGRYESLIAAFIARSVPASAVVGSEV